MIDMGNMLIVMDRVARIALYLDGQDVTDVEDTKEKAEVRSHKAETSRQLLELADLCALAEALVRNEYWIFKNRGLDVEVGEFRDE